LYFGGKLTTFAKQVREKCGVTQREVAIATGVTERTINRIENDPSYSAGGKILRALADFYGCSIDNLLCRDGSQL